MLYQVKWFGGNNYFIFEDNGIEDFSTVFLGTKESCQKYLDSKKSD